MRLALPFCFLLVSASGALARSPDEPASALRAAIRKAYDAESAALTREDVSGVLVFYHRDFVYAGPDARRYRLPQMHAILSQTFESLEGIKSRVEIGGIAREGKTARATVIERLDALLPARQNKGRLHIQEKRVDDWIPSGRTWVKISSRVMSRAQSLNGKPFPPPPKRKRSL